MSLQAILDHIQASGDAQVSAIRQQAGDEIRAILADAETQAESCYHAASNQALEPETGERARILNQARFEALCLVGKARESLAQRVLTDLEHRLRGIRSSPEYPDVLLRILFEILPGEDGRRKLEDTIVIEADPRDRELLESILQKRELKPPVEYTLTCWGGLNAHSHDGTVRLINTLEARFERVLPDLKQHLVTWFEKEKAKNPQPEAQIQG